MSTQAVREKSRMVRAFAALARILLAGMLVYALIPASAARADTSVCGQITEDTTWSSAGNSYIVTCNVTVVLGVRLTIEPDVVVKFDLGTSLLVNGELIAHAATFTTNDPTPAKGDWGQILFAATSEDAVFDGGGNYVSGSIIQESVIEWGGGGEGVSGMVQTAGASPFLSNNTIRYSSSRGVHALGRSSNTPIKIAQNAISANGGGVHISAGVLDHNTVSNNSAGYGSGGGVYAEDSLLTHNDISSNSGGFGAGIYARGGTLSYNNVSGNVAPPCVGSYDLPCYPNPARDGGGIYSNGSVLVGNLVSGNSLGNHYGDEAFGGGIYAVGGTLSDNTITGNVITGGGSRGGGIYSSLSTLTGNVVESNSVNGHNASGGGIYITGGSVTGNTVAGNTATCAADETSYGGGVYANGGTVSGNTISNNIAAGGSESRGGGVYGSVNTISGNTLSGNSAMRGGAIYSNKGTVAENTVTNNTTSWSGSIYMYEGTALGNTVQGNSAVNGGGICGNNAVLTGNTVQNNTANLGGGIIATGSTVRGNTVTGNAAQSDGGGIYVDGGTVTGNTITGNTVPSYGHGSGAYLSGAGEFTYNSVTGNTSSGGTAGGISIDGQPQVRYNNLYDNLPYDAEILSADPVTGTHNYWGESLCTAIPWQIYDGNDLPDRGILSYAPSLYLPVPVAQLDAPTGLEIDIGEAAVALSWTPIAPLPDIGCRPPGWTGPDLAYHVWYSLGKPCGPFDGTGLPAGGSPIDTGEATSYVLDGLGPGEYYFVVAAHDYLGRESAFTNSVVRPATGYWIHLPLVVR